jgi:hypothetical protein
MPPICPQSASQDPHRKSVISYGSKHKTREIPFDIKEEIKIIVCIAC